MKKINIALLLIQLLVMQAFAQPTSNPIADHYRATGEYPEWTNEINWYNVIEMENKNDPTLNFQEFEAKRDLLYSQGGGVLYYPGGTYEFDVPDGPADRGLMLKEGIVIRGEKPATDTNAITTDDILTMGFTDHGLKSLPTKFVFKLKDIGIEDSVVGMWNMVGAIAGTNEAHLGEVDLVGIAWVELENAFVYFGVGNKGYGDTTYSGSASWLSTRPFLKGWGARIADGSHPMDMFCAVKWKLDTALMGTKRFVFGCHIKNGMVPNYINNKPKVTGWITDPGGWKWGARIGVNGSHVYVANNVIPKPTNAFMMNYTCGKRSTSGDFDEGTVVTTVYDPAYSIGIDVNKSLLSGFYNVCAKGYGDLTRATYVDDVFIQDNWIYNRGNKGVELSGKWLICRNNVNKRDIKYRNGASVYGLGTQEQAEVEPSDGTCNSNEGTNDFQSRGFDVGGWNIWVHNNRYTGTGSLGNDGEGILIQRHGGYEALSFAYTFNKQGATGEKGYLAPYDVHAIGLFQAWNTQRGEVGLNKPGDNWGEDISAADSTNLDLNGNPSTILGIAGANVKDFLYTCGNPVSPADAPSDVNVSVNFIEGSATITWVDNSPDEIGFRVDRKLKSTSEWRTIAYRPRSETISTELYSSISTTSNYNSTAECWPDVTINSFNPQQWVDYTYHLGEEYDYRVVAISCADSNGVVVEKPSIAVSAEKVSLFPNPVELGKVVEVNTTLTNYTIEIFDTKGTRLFYQENNDYSTLINTTGLEKGVKIIRISRNNQSEVFVNKFIIE